MQIDIWLSEKRVSDAVSPEVAAALATAKGRMEAEEAEFARLRPHMGRFGSEGFAVHFSSAGRMGRGEALLWVALAAALVFLGLLLWRAKPWLWSGL